jgi:hypothetical protein
MGIEGSIKARPLIRSKLRGMDPRGIQPVPTLTLSKVYVVHWHRKNIVADALNPQRESTSAKKVYYVLHIVF